MFIHRSGAERGGPDHAVHLLQVQPQVPADLLHRSHVGGQHEQVRGHWPKAREAGGRCEVRLQLQQRHCGERYCAGWRSQGVSLLVCQLQPTVPHGAYWEALQDRNDLTSRGVQFQGFCSKTPAIQLLK